MERQIVRENMLAVKSRGDLLKLLNSLKLEEEGALAPMFTMAQLSYFCNPKKPKRFKVFNIPKKSGGQRVISAPVKVLKSMLHYLNVALSSMYFPKRCVMGFTEGRSVADNARMHVRQNYVLNIDLSNFFPSIDQARVWKRLQVKPYNLSVDVASVIAGLCSIEIESQDGNKRFVLPQGSPISPLLSNIICERLDYKLTKLARDFGLNYSRYADDMTFSSMHNVYQENGEFIISLRRIVAEENFVMNEKKTRLQKRGARQEVTGLNVTAHANVTKKYVNWIRTIIHIWEKYGYQEAYSNFYKKYKSESCHKHNGEPNLVSVLSGKLLYMKMVKGEKDSTFSKLNERFTILVRSLDEYTPTDNNLKYFLSYTILGFEKKYSVVIDYKEISSSHVFGFSISNRWQNVILSKEVDKDKFIIFLKKLHNRIEGQKITGQYYISLCSGRDARLNRTNNFWLVTTKKPLKIVGNINLDISLILEMYKKEGVDSVLSFIGEQNRNITKEPKSKEANDKNHNPKAMVSALYKFSQHDTIKWFTHKPDSNTIDVQTLLSMTTDQLYKALLNGSRHDIINKRTWNNIKSFVLHECNNRRPLNADDEDIMLSWGDESVREWCNNNPSEHPYYADFNGISFSSSISEFKHTIEFRTDVEDMTFRNRIKDLLDCCAEKLDLEIEYQDDFIEMDTVQLFVDVRLIFKSIKMIMTWIGDNNSKGKVVSIDVNNTDEYVELVIYHIGSELSMQGKKREGLDGDFEELRMTLLAVADLRLEADHKDGKSYSITCLAKGYQAKNYNLSKNIHAHMKTPCSWEKINEKVGGVKYFIKMYKNI